MNLLLRQLWALIRKNLLIICVRKLVSTFIRAIAIPLIIVLVVAYSRNFFHGQEVWGVSSAYPIRSFRDGLTASSDHIIVAFADNGMKNGAVQDVIDALSSTVREAGKTPKLYANMVDLVQECTSNPKGISPCYAGVVFHSSPREGSVDSVKGFWNYTILGDKTVSGDSDIRRNGLGTDVYMLPLQRALDQEIISRSTSNNTSVLPPIVEDMPFTYMPQEALIAERTGNYLTLCIYVFGAIFSFTMIGIVFHLTSFVSGERELGMSSLIDTMLPGGSATRARMVRQVSTYISFVLIYLPSWLVVGVVISVVVFPTTSHGIPVGYHILSGLAFCSFGQFGAAFFKKAQLSGSIMIVITLVFAILPQVLYQQGRGLVLALSFIFPSANYTYFINSLALWEAAGRKASVTEDVPDHKSFGGGKTYRPRIYVYFLFLAVQIVVFPILAFAVEHILFSTASAGRRFTPATDARGPTVTLSGFGKTYKPGLLARLFKRRKETKAVEGLDLNAYHGQILCLLGPNGSGKSTTLNCITGEQKVTSGSIAIDSAGGLGHAPQANVIWPELTVEEHIRIFSDLKCLAVANEEVIADLVRRCDLEGKLTARAKTLSGGQKRKLQLAIMFAGGSAVCCVDEVSTGLDPISRRRIWEILLAERSNRTILMTTHFLDEADFLADNIAILYKGSLKAEGTSVALKNTFGNGYTVKIANSVDLEIILSGPVEKETSRHQTVYRVATAALVAELVDFLEHHNIEDYQVSGPTMEELFLKATGDAMNTDEHSPAEEVVDVPGQVKIPSALDGGHSYYLVDGQPLNAFYQWWILFCKRLRILKRRFIPYGVILALSLVGAGVSPKLIKGYTERIGCPSSADTFDYYTYRLDFGSNGFYSKYLLGPMDQVDSARLEEFANIYSPKYDEYQDPYSPKQRNLTTLRKALVPLNSTEEMAQYLKAQQNYVDSPYYGDREFVYGGVWLGDSPTISFLAEDALFGLQVQNMMNILLSGVPISAAYSNFSWKNFPLLYDFRALEFIIYFGLIMACYPAFFALYPTNERISNVRPMQYSNGIRPLPLWLSHLAFDAIFVVIISAVGVALLSVATTAWLGIGYIFLVMLFYGIVATLQSYIISMFAKSAIAAWFFCTVMQIILYFAYFGALLGIQSNVEYKELEHYNNAVSFGIGIISPIVNLEKAFFIGLGQMGFLCNGRSASSVYLYGGPILYLVLQGFLLFAILLWWDTSFVLPSFRKNKQLSDSEAQEMDSADMIAEVKRINSKSTDLRVENLSKRFGKNLAVDNVTFGVQNSEIFALLGPNGAGKSTIISMIRGDIKPSTPTSSIHIAGHSILSSPIIARAHLGVCPQFDSADVLTVKETLRFFAKTRGVGDVDHNVATVIAACGLEPWTNQLAQKLSGGTKRKLSLAVALVGNPRVLVLDEPSSALDANAKRNMWRTLQSIGKNRSIVLTTHSMEEADALADRIGIVSSRMLAIGDREALKKRAGDAFHIHLVAKSAPRTTPQELHVMKDWIAAKFAGARISRETQGGQIRFEVPAEGQNLVGLIKMLEHAKEELGVEFFSVGKATLDEVFENIVKKYGNNGDYAMDEK